MRVALLSLVLLASLSAACTDDEPPLARMGIDALHDCKPDGCPAIPILRVDDLQKAQRYYRDVLGFTLEWEDGEPPDFAAVRKGDAVFFLCQRCQGKGASWSFVFVDDADRVHREMKARGARIKMAPKDEPWRLRELHVADLDDNVIRFASPLKKR